ncbi:MAG: NAD(P)H-hydrate epimerase, partial [Caldisericia bacterium]|nr:NAD(P)H-hydrate epimerase [Caldisericia bacterium]
MIVHTGFDTRRTDSIMETEYKVFPLQLMEVAGKSVADQVHLDFDKNLNDVLILIGPGNNGGDGCVVARFLISYGWSVTILPVFELKQKNGPANDNASILKELCNNPTNKSVILEPYESSEKTREKISLYLKNKNLIIVDALFGVGLTRGITGYAADLIGNVNESQCKTYSLDIPSGISSYNGNVLGKNGKTAIMADVTVTFEAPKVGHLIYPGKEHTGNLVIVNIGIPKNIVNENVSIRTYLNYKQAKELIKSRPSNSHKGLFGKVLCLTGSKQYQGAITLVLEGALHAGAGLITSCYKENLSNILSQRVIPEATHCAINVVDGK